MTNNTTMNLKLAIDALMKVIDYNDIPVKKMETFEDGYIHFILADGTAYEWDGLDLEEYEEEE